MSKPASRPGKDEDFVLLCDLVTKAGAIALDYFSRGVETRIKADGTQVSEADFAVDRFLKEKMLEARPGYGWLSEESEDDPGRLSAGHVFVVDPIDGTRAFLNQKSQWVVSAALLENAVPIMGCVYNPVLDEFFSARAGGGATCNDVAIAASRRSELAGSRIVGSKTLFKSEIWSSPWPDVETYWANSIAYRLCLVADGRADATLSLSEKSEWDVAAAQVILQEAGGVVTAHDGSAYAYNQPVPRQKSVVAAGPALHPQLLERTKPLNPVWLGR